MEPNDNVISASPEFDPERLHRFKAGVFLASVTGISAFSGFCYTIASAKKKDPVFFNKGVVGSAELADTGAILAMRALGWGTFFAITGTSLLCYGIWKLSGANNLKEFRTTMGNILPRVPKNDPPQSRTEFSGMNDLLNYLATEKFGKS